MFKFNNKDTRTTPMASHLYFTPCSSVSTVNFEQVNVGWYVLKHLTQCLTYESFQVKNKPAIYSLMELIIERFTEINITTEIS